MKKIAAGLLAVLMLLIPVSAIHIEQDNAASVWTNGVECVGCFDVFYLEYPDGVKSQAELYGVEEGGANYILSLYPIYVTEELSVICYGWSGLRSGVPIDVYGYKINSGDAVYDELFKLDDAEPAVIAAGGDSRYSIAVPIAGITDPALITLVFKDVNGDEHDFIEFPINGGYKEPDTGEGGDPAVFGDVNNDGKLNNKDVVTLFRYVLDENENEYNAVFDVNRDGKVNNKDVVYLFRVVTSLIVPVITEAPVVNRIAVLQDRYFLYGTTEPDSVVYVEYNGKQTENKANNKYFYIDSGANWGDTVYVYAKVQGKEASSKVAVTITPTASSDNAWIGKNSRLFYASTYGFLVSNQADMSSLASIKNCIINKTINDIQNATGKNTKLIFAIIPDPATAYYDEQPDYIHVPTPLNTAMQSFVSAIDRCHEDVYALDLLSVMRAHKDERIYFTTDTHYTELGAYYAYLEIMKRVRETYPDITVKTLENGDYNLEYADVGGGDLTNITGVPMNEVIPYFTANFTDTGSYYLSKRADGIKTAGFGPSAWERSSTLENSNNPTAYFIGDSYGCYILPFLGANFSKMWTNVGVLWNYDMDVSILSQNKPDYVIFLMCQRNISPVFMQSPIAQFATSIQ